MNAPRTAWDSDAFRALVEHLDAFGQPQRRALAKRYGAPGEAPEVLARFWCEHPERVRRVVLEGLRSSRARHLLEDLVLDHDLLVPIDWAGRRPLRQLVELGVLPPLASRGRGMARQAMMPGALAACLAPMVSGSRPSLPILLGRMPVEQVCAIAAHHGVAEGPIIPVILELGERFARRGVIDDILAQLPDPDWLGGVLMAIELGGLCYWQEVFGTGVAEQPGVGEGGAKVVPLMRDFERRQEQDIAQLLSELGVIFRIEGDHLSHPMLAIPEELWIGFWSLGRTWLMDWIVTCHGDLREGATTRLAPVEEDDPQARLKWICCEAACRGLHTPLLNGEVSRLAESSALDPGLCELTVELGVNMGVLEVDEDGRSLRANPRRLELLDAPRAVFARRVMFDWCVGLLGARADRHAPQALGIDEQWRQQILALDLGAADVHLPTWVFHEGIDSQLTGAGYLRSLESSEPNTLLLELGMVTHYVWNAKLLWLDLLSLLEGERWYALGLIQELLQLVSALTIFNLLSHVLENPGVSHYLPVQRASFLTDPLHTSAFDAWVRAILEEVFVPLGVAVVEGERVMLSTRHLRVVDPPGVPEDSRAQALRELFEDPNMPFDVPSAAQSALRPVAAVPEPDEERLSLDLPASLLLECVEGRQIERYVGRVLELSDPA